MGKEFITLEDASKLCGHKIHTLRNKVSLGILKRYGSVGKILLDRDEVVQKLVLTKERKLMFKKRETA